MTEDEKLMQEEQRQGLEDIMQIVWRSRQLILANRRMREERNTETGAYLRHSKWRDQRDGAPLPQEYWMAKTDGYRNAVEWMGANASFEDLEAMTVDLESISADLENLSAVLGRRATTCRSAVNSWKRLDRNSWLAATAKRRATRAILGAWEALEEAAGLWSKWGIKDLQGEILAAYTCTWRLFQTWRQPVEQDENLPEGDF